jgi:hypothetical protein
MTDQAPYTCSIQVSDYTSSDINSSYQYKFQLNDTYNAINTTTATGEIERDDTSLSINVDDTVAIRGQTLAFTGVLTDTDVGSGVEGKNITLNKDGVYTGAWDLTDAAGSYTIYYTIPSTESYGTYNYSTEFAGDSAYKAAGSSNLTIEVILAPLVEDVTVDDNKGWGEAWNFKANITADEAAPNVTSWLQFNRTGTWENIVKQECVDCTVETQKVFATNWTKDDIGEQWYRFYSNDSNQNVNVTAPRMVNVERDDLEIRYAEGNESFVNRSNLQPGNERRLATQAWDLDVDNYTVDIDTANFFTYVWSGSAWIEENETKNATHFYLDFNPNCSYQAGKQKWKMNVSNAQYYKDASSIEFNITIVGDLDNTIIEPDGATNYTKGFDVINLNGSVLDDCGAAITDASVYFNLTNQDTGDTYRCPSTGYATQQNGYYNCSWDTTGKPVGTYLVEMFSSRTDHNDGYDSVSFYLSSAPILESPTVIPSSGGWGRSPYNYTVNVTDEDNDTVTIYLWLKNETGNWSNPENKTCTNCNNTLVYFEVTYTKYNIGWWWFKFNATDEHDNTNETINQSHYVDKDTISINLLEGNNSEVNRSLGSTRLAVSVYDSDQQENTTDVSQDKVRWWITNNSEWREEYESINATGVYYYLDFDPDCNYTANLQKWQVNVSTSSYYKNATSDVFYVKVIGDLNATLLQPDGTTNYTRPDQILMRGLLTDDCGNVTGATVRFVVESGNDTYYCEGAAVNDEGDGYYNCTWDSSVASAGWFNVTMEASKNYYNPDTHKIENAFYLKVVPELKGADVTPRAEGWSVQRTFTVNVTDPGDNVTVRLWERKPGFEWVQIGDAKYCYDCVNYTLSWTRDYTCSEVESNWQFKFNATDTEGTSYDTEGNPGDYVGGDYTYDIERDDVQLIYVAGNDTTATKTSPTLLILRVNDTDKGDFVTSPNASVVFNLTKTDAISNYNLIAGTVETNDTGYANFYLYASCQFDPGSQYWLGYINPGDTCYKDVPSENFTVTLDMFCPEFNVTEVLGPSEAFQYKLFGINATIRVKDRNATNTNASLFTPNWVVSPSVTQYLDTIEADVGETTYQDVSWGVNATDLTPYQIPYTLNVTANTSAPTEQGYYEHTNRTNVTVYKLLPDSCPAEALLDGSDVKAEVCTINVTLGESLDNSSVEAEISSKSLIASWSCPAGNYRTGKLTVYWEAYGLTTGTKARIQVYNGTDWIDILHSFFVGANATKDEIPILEQQIAANESGYCLVKIENVGDENLMIDYLSFEAYYEPAIKILDIIPEIGDEETYGMEPGDGLFNVTIRVANSINQSYTVDITLNVTNSTGYVVDSSTHTGVNLPANGTIEEEFVDINTSTWSEDTYNLEAYVTSISKPTERIEQFIFKSVNVTAKGAKYMCNGTEYMEEFYVTVQHPFTDEVSYNVTLQMPTGWSYEPSYQIVNGIEPGDITATFNLTAGVGTYDINATVSYTYPNYLDKSKTASFTVEANSSIPILEVIRETPKLISKDRVFESALVVHNKGCAATSENTTVKEKLSAGWTPANPDLKGDIQLIDAKTDLENNILTWRLGEIKVNKYAVLTYQIKSPPTYPTLGTLSWNITWDGKSDEEEEPFEIQTFNYTSESHLEFDLEALQKPDYPWGEPRSIQPNMTYNYSLKVTNIGDIPTGYEWNVTLEIPSACNVTQVYNNGTWDPVARKIEWELPNITVRKSTYLNFTVECSETGRYILKAEGIRDTRTEMSFINDTSIGCSDSSCSISQNYTFTKPPEARYEKLSQIDFYISYDWSAYNLTIGQGYVNISDDNDGIKLVWQNYSFADIQGSVWSNYTLDEDEQGKFIDAKREIGVGSYVDGTYNPLGNVTVEKLSYTWKYGRLFEEPQDLFTKVKVYVYYPLLENATIQPSDGGWGLQRNFSVMVKDRFGRNVTVYAWHRKGAAAYTLIDNWTCINCSTWTQANFTYKYDCADIGSWSFKFNATNPDGSATEYGSSYEIQKDYVSVTIVSPSGGSTVNRSTTTQFILEIYDVDNQSVPYELMTGGTDEGKGVISISKYGSNETFDKSPYLSANATGHIIREMVNTSDQWCKTSDYYLGQNWWKGGVSSATCYENNITDIIPFMLYGDLYNTLIQPDGTTNFTRGVNVTFEASVIDDCGSSRTADSTINFTMIRGSNEYSCIADITGQCKITTDDTFPLGWYNVTTLANKTYHNDGATFDENLFFLGTVPELTAPTVIPSVGGWGESPFDFSINVTDIDNNTVIVKFYLKNQTDNVWFEVANDSCTNCDNTKLSFQYNFTKYNIDDWRFRFIANDSAGFSNDTENIYTTEMDFVVEKDDVEIIYLEGDGSEVNRSAGAVLLKIRINDTDKAEIVGSGVNCAFWVETDTINYGPTLTNTTDVDGNCSYYFDPNETYEAGVQNWTGGTYNDQYYKDVNLSVARYLTIYGDLFNVIEDPGDYNVSDQITVRGKVTDDIGNNVTSASVTFEFSLDGSSWELCSPTKEEGDGWYNCTWDSTGKAEGYWDVRMNSSKAYHNSNFTIETDLFFLNNLEPEGTSLVVDPAVGGWGETFTYNVSITDPENDNVTCTLLVNTQGSWISKGSMTDQAPYTCSIQVSDYTSSDINSSYQYKFQLNDTYNTVDTSVSTGEIEKDDTSVDINVDDTLVIRGQVIRFSGTLLDTDANEGVAGETVMLNKDGSYTGISNSTNSTGGYVIDYQIPSTESYGNHTYNVTFNGTAAYKAAGSSNLTIEVILAPLVEDVTVDDNKGWGEAWNFKANITADEAAPNVTSWLQFNRTGTWENIVKQECVDCTVETQKVFATNWTKDDIGEQWYRFYSNDSNQNVNVTAPRMVNVERDDINITHTAGNNSEVNRSAGSVRLATQVWDIDITPNNYTVDIDNATAFFTYITTDTVNWKEENESVNETHFYIDFDPGCDYAADEQYWKMNVSNAQYYKDGGSAIFIVKIYGDLNATYIEPTGLQEFERGEESITFKGNVTDDCQQDVTNADVKFKLEGPSTYWCNSTSTSNPYTCVFDTTGKEIGNYNVTMIVTKAYYNSDTDFEEDAVRIKSSPRLEVASVDIESDGWSLTRTFRVNVTDNIGDTDTVYLWESFDGGISWIQIGSPQQCTNCSDTVLEWSKSYTCNDIGLVKFKFNATDTEGNSDETTTAETGDYETDDTFTVEANNIWIEYVAGNETNATIEQSTALILRVYDMDSDTYSLSPSATIAFNITKEGIGSTYYTIDSNTTNSTGYVVFNFLPDQSFNVTKQSWRGFTDSVETCYKFNQSDEYNVTTLTNVPKLVNATVDILTEGWGIARTFNITVYDQNNTATVYLWRSTSLTGPWTLMDSKTYTNVSNWETLSYLINFSCADLQGAEEKIWYYKFNASNEVGNMNETTPSSDKNFTLEKENVLLEYYAGHGSVANRKGAQTDFLSYRLRDENGSYLSGFGVKFFVTTDNVSWYSDAYFEVLTNSSGYANFDFNPTCTGDYTGAPKFLVGEQQWKIEVNSSELSCYKQNVSYTFEPRNLFVWGDLTLEFAKPEYDKNYTQEDIVPFSGAVVDDCGDVVKDPYPTVRYFANKSDGYYECSPVERLGENAFVCDWETTIYTSMTWYNATMTVNRSYHYDNSSVRVDTPGLFYLKPIYKLLNPTAVPEVAGWGYYNRNFSVNVSSGDSETLQEVSIYMATAWPPATECEPPTCVNQTPVECMNCIGDVKYWYRNFTYEDIGVWYYQFKMSPAGIETKDVESIEVTKDNVSIEQGVTEYNDTAAVANDPTKYANLTVRVKDIIRDEWLSVPKAYLTFEAHDGISWQFVGTVETNDTGHATFQWAPTCEPYFPSGTTWWRAKINESQYDYWFSNTSVNYTVEVDSSACVPTIQVYKIKRADEHFQNITFGINATIRATQTDATDVNATIVVPDGWEVWNGTDWNNVVYLGSILSGKKKDAHWDVKPNSSGTYTLTIYTNATMSGEAKSDQDTTTIFVYTWYEPTSMPEPSLPVVLDSGDNITTSISCGAYDFRIASLKISSENVTAGPQEVVIRIQVYNGTDWNDVSHSFKFVLNGSREDVIPILSNQIYANETGYCVINITNTGLNSLNITGLVFEGYYNESVQVQDIQVKINNQETTGLEPSETLFNVTIKIVNSKDQSISGTLWLNITNSTGYLVNYSSQSVSLAANSIGYYEVLNVNTSTWSQDDYNLLAYLDYGDGVKRAEPLIFKEVQVSSKSVDLMCNQTTEEYTVTIVHPFTDPIIYTVTLEVPTGWSYSPASKTVQATEPGSYETVFDITSSDAAAETVVINASVTYTYPSGLSKEKESNYTIYENSSMPILEVIREMTGEYANNTEIYGRIIVYNKGCDYANSLELKEKFSAGWVAYEPTVDGETAGTTDIPNRELRFDSEDLKAPIRAGDYRIISYKLLTYGTLNDIAVVQYNLSWDGFNVYEDPAFVIKTLRYIQESHLSFDLVAEGSWKKRTTRPMDNQTYSLIVINDGDINITSGEWNVSLYIPENCSVSNFTGSWDAVNRKITWQLGNLSKSEQTSFNFTMNCTTTAKYILTAEGEKTTIEETTFVNDTSIGCQGSSCSITYEFNFTKPSDPRYEKMEQVDFLINYEWNAYNLTLALGNVKFGNDNGDYDLVWQNFSLSDESNQMWYNYTIYENDQVWYTNSKQDIIVSSYVDGMADEFGNVTVTKIVYTWKTGRLFNDTHPLFVRIEPYIVVPDPPELQSPPNASVQVSSPLVLSWFSSENADYYYVFGDNSTGDTLLGSTNVTNFLWSLEESGTYYWKVVAAAVTDIGEINSSDSEIWQFTLDLCAPDPAYEYALEYPMSYDNVTDTIIVYGNSTLGTSDNPITFEHIYEFGRAQRGICAVTKPATGTYVIMSRLFIGNGSDVWVKSKGESISFTSSSMPQLLVNQSAHLIFGSVRDGIPQEGCSLKFTSYAFDDILLDIAGGEIAFYDSYVTDVGSTWGRFIYRGGCGSGDYYSAQNSSVTIRKTIFDRASRGHFFYTSNVTIDDMKINRINSSAAYGYGIVAACNLPTLNYLQIYHQEQNGSAISTTADMPNYTMITIQDSVFRYNIKDVIATANGRGVRLVNTEWGRTYGWNFGGGNGTGSVTIEEIYSFYPTFVDTSAIPIENLTMVLLDRYGEVKVVGVTDSEGKVGEKYITTWMVEKTTTGETESNFNPHVLYGKRYGYTFISEGRTFEARTVETKVIESNPFVNLPESEAAALANITYVPPLKVSYGDEWNSSWSTSGQLKNYPIDQCQYFALFANDTKLAEGLNYTINYATGEITFLQDVSNYTIYPVYFYGGNITLTNGYNLTGAYTLNDIYDYMQYQTSQNNLTEDVYTVDGVTYTFCVDLIIGNETAQGSISDPEASINFKDGYGLSFEGKGGYVDLAGITAAGGEAGGLPLNIYDDVGSIYEPGDIVEIFSTTLDSQGNLVSASVSIYVYYPDGSLLTSGTSTEISTGRFEFNFTLPSNAPEGTYRVDIDATYAGDSVHDNLAFLVSIGGDGAGTPEVVVDAPAVIDTNIYFDITAVVKSAAGVLVNCDGSANITIRDTLAGVNEVLNVPMVHVATGEYKYTWITSNQSTYLAIVECIISGVEYVGTKEFSTQSVPGLTTEQEEALYETRELTRQINETVAASLEASGAYIAEEDKIVIHALFLTGFGEPIPNASCTVSIMDESLAELVVNASMSEETIANETHYVYRLENVSNLTNITQVGKYFAHVRCKKGTLEKSTEISFEVESILLEILEALKKRFRVKISDFGEILPDEEYRAKVWIYDYQGAPMNASTIPLITIYDPLRNIIVQNAEMTYIETGIYEYVFIPSSTQTTGIWETVATVNVSNVIVKPSDYWEFEASPCRVEIVGIIDNTVPDITADVIIENEGGAAYEYHYEYCIVSDQYDQCGGNNDVDYASGSKLLQAGETWNPKFTLSVPEEGDYYFKVVVYWGTEKSGASRKFTAIPPVVAPVPKVPLPMVLLPLGEIKIIEYPTNISIYQGDFGYYLIKIMNVGGTTLHEVKVLIEGIPEEWYEIMPEETDTLKANETKTYILKIKVPIDARPDSYPLYITASSKESVEKVSSVLNVLPRIVIPLLRLVDAEVSTPLLLVGEEGYVRIFIENMDTNDLNVHMSIILPEKWSAKKTEINKTIAPLRASVFEFKVIPKETGIFTLTLKVEYDGKTTYKDIYAQVIKPEKPVKVKPLITMRHVLYLAALQIALTGIVILFYGKVKKVYVPLREREIKEQLEELERKFRRGELAEVIYYKRKIRLLEKLKRKKRKKDRERLAEMIEKLRERM